MSRAGTSQAGSLHYFTGLLAARLRREAGAPPGQYSVWTPPLAELIGLPDWKLTFERSVEDEETEETEETPEDYLRVHYTEILLEAPLGLWGQMLAWLEQLSISSHDLRSRAANFARLVLAQREATPQAAPGSSPELLRYLADEFAWQSVKAEFGPANLPYVRLGVGVEPPEGTPVVVVTAAQAQTAEEVSSEVAGAVAAARQLYGSVPRQFLALALSPATPTAQLASPPHIGSQLLLLDEPELKHAILSPSPGRTCHNYLIRKMGISVLNPYRSEKPVDTPDMFYGRTREIRDILHNPSTDFAIFGPRRIGKTSLLLQLGRMLHDEEDAVVTYLDCALGETPTDVLQRLCFHIAPRKALRVFGYREFERVVREARATSGRPCVILLDEIDSLLALAHSSNDWSFFSSLRYLSQLQYVQCVVTGFRSLFRESYSLESPLYNFCHPMYLSVLEKEEALRLIEAPMNRIGVHFKDPRIARSIVEYTGGHPSFVQFLGWSIIQTLGRRGGRVVTIDVLEEVLEDAGFRNRVLQPLLVQEGLARLERLAVLVLAQESVLEFQPATLGAHLDSVGLRLSGSEVLEAVQHLELSGVIHRVGNNPDNVGSGTGLYGITIPILFRFLRQSMDLRREIELTIDAERESKREP